MKRRIPKHLEPDAFAYIELVETIADASIPNVRKLLLESKLFPLADVERFVKLLKYERILDARPDLCEKVIDFPLDEHETFDAKKWHTLPDRQKRQYKSKRRGNESIKQWMVTGRII